MRWKSAVRRSAGGTLAALLAVICIGSVAPDAQAATPAWKLLAATGPTNLPPRQSETQRITVQAEGGTFALTVAAGESTIAPVAYDGTVSVTAGSSEATIETVEGDGFQVGDRVAGAGLPFGEAFVVSCSSDCKTAGSTVTFSVPAEETTSGAFAVVFTREAVVEEGSIPVGAEISGVFVPAFVPGTVVTEVVGGTVKLSRPPSSEFFAGETVRIAATERTTPVPFDSPSADLQKALEALPALGAGAVHVESGQGSATEHRFFIDFGGPFAEEDVEALGTDSGGLIGAHAAIQNFTTVPGGAGTGEITINPANIGGADTSGVYTVEVGPLPDGVVTRAPAEGEGWICAAGVGAASVSCESEVQVEELSTANNIIVPIEVTSPREISTTVPVAIRGGGASSDAIQMPLVVSRQEASNGVAALWAGSFDSNGQLEVQAGGHPYSAATYFMLNTVRLPSGRIVTPGDPKEVLVDLPPGFVGNPMVTARCPQSQLVPPVNVTKECDVPSAIGGFQPLVNDFGSATTSLRAAIWNDVPPKGYAAEFTTEIASPIQSLLASVRSSEDYGVQIKAMNNPNFARIFGAFAALRGAPAGGGGKPFLTSATSCAENARQAPSVFTEVETWQTAGRSHAAQVGLPPVTGCEKLEFTPSFGFAPGTTVGSSGTGATATLKIPQENLLEPTKLAEPALKKAVVSLPAGVTLNPSSANGLEACSEAQMGLVTTTGDLPNPIRFDESAPNCPDGSKLGTVTVRTPLLEEEVGGTIYLAEQERNPFGSLLAIYLAIESPRFGLEVKLAGKVDIDPSNGQLTATFDYNPQLPVEELKLNFRGGGPRSELATPEVCGHYATTGSLEPWSAPESGPDARIQEGGFDVTTNCSSADSARPFAPTFEAGTTGTQAGAYNPLVVKVGRKDGEQELKTLDFTLPKGLLAKLAGVPYCPEGAIQNAEHKSGKEEQVSASCPAASRIGSVDTAAGVGSEPFHVGGSVYLAGPYKGAPLSSVVVTPAVAGPFDLGDVVVRAPLYVDPETAEVTAKSDPIPTILKGIPLKVRSVAINLDRPAFSLNPTSCNVMMATASIGGSSGATAKPSNRFQVGGCDKLKFKPNLKISLRGATKHTGLPALKAVVTYPKQGAYANIQRAQVNLPHSEFLEQNNLNKTCTKPVLLEGKCPKTTIYGKAKAWSPLLDAPLEGPVFLVGGYGYKLPALVAELNGQIRVLLKGKVDSGPNKGIRATFEMVPDAPVSRFVLEMKGGKKYGLLINSEGLCGKKQRANSIFRAQNGLVQHTKPLIANQCGKKKAKKGSKGKKPHGKKK
jgi:hypothetical protein